MTTLPTTTTTTTSTSPPAVAQPQITSSIFVPSGLKRINSVSLSDSWKGYGVSPSGSGITNFIAAQSYIHYENFTSSDPMASPLKITPNDLLKQSDTRFDLYDSNLRDNGPKSITTTTTSTTTPSPIVLGHLKKI